jgi:hypothetical protein
MLVAVALTTIGSAAQAQDIDLSAGNSAVIWRGTSTNSRAGTFLDQSPVGLVDGSRDLIVGAPGVGAVTGRVYILFNNNNKTGSQNLSAADVTISGATAGDGFGTMAAAGNILNTENSNPRNLLVAAPQAQSGRGVVYLFAAGFSAGSYTTANAAYTIVGAPGDLLGTSLATGDLNNDGRREIIIGAPGNNRVYIINGSAGLSGTRQLETTPADLTLPAAGFGVTVASGDVTGDNIYDLIVGSQAQNAVFVYKGRAGGISAGPDVYFSGIPGEAMGNLVRLGDLDNDGIRDIQIGSPLSDGPGGARPDSGAIYVMWGSAALASRAFASSPADVTFFGEAAGQQLGTFFNYGDINRDTPDDLAMSAFGPGGASQLQIFYGRGSKNQFGVPFNGRRAVDLAQPGSINRRVYGIPANGAISAVQIFEVTGEGARDIIVGVSTESNGGTAGAGSVHFTLSPRMFLSSKTMTFRLRQNDTGQAGVDVRNTSAIPITWSARSKVPWMSVSPASGSTVNGAFGFFTITVAPGAMLPGTYVGQVEVESTSVHLDMTQSVTVTVVIRPISAGPLDFDGDRKAEIAIFRPSSGTWALRQSSTGYATGANYTWGVNGDIPVPGDYDGDRIIDIAVYRPSAGYWFFLMSTTNYSTWGTYQWGSTGDIPMPADYDGDARTDIAIYRPSTGGWYILKSTSNFTAGAGYMWGAPGDRPIAADFDGDGKVDLTVYRPGSGHWFILLSTTNYASWWTIQWGNTGDIMVPADYDGDLRTDLAVYRPSNGTWYVLTSSSGYLSGLGYVWGAGADSPMPADYDGDGKADFAVYRPSTGHWFLLLSSSNYTSWITYQWGTTGDVPVGTLGQIQ